MPADDIPSDVKKLLQKITQERAGKTIESMPSLEWARKQWEEHVSKLARHNFTPPKGVIFQYKGGSYLVPEESEGAGVDLPRTAEQSEVQGFSARYFGFLYAIDAGRLLFDLASRAAGGGVLFDSLSSLSVIEAQMIYDRLHLNCLAHLAADPDQAGARLDALLQAAFENRSLGGLESFILTALISEKVSNDSKYKLSRLIEATQQEFDVYNNNHLNLMALDFIDGKIHAVRQKSFIDVLSAYQEARQNKSAAALALFRNLQSQLSLSLQETDWCTGWVGVAAGLASDKAAAAIVAASRPAIVEAGSYIGGGIGSLVGPEGAVPGSIIGATIAPSVARVVISGVLGIEATARTGPIICASQSTVPASTSSATPSPRPSPPPPTSTTPHDIPVREPYHHEAGNSCGNFGHDPSKDPDIMVAYPHPDQDIGDGSGGTSIIRMFERLIVKTGPCVPNPDFRELAGKGFVPFGALTQMLLIGDEMYVQWGINAPLVHPSGSDVGPSTSSGINILEKLTQSQITDPPQWRDEIITGDDTLSPLPEPPKNPDVGPVRQILNSITRLLNRSR